MLSVARVARCGLSAHNVRTRPIRGALAAARRWNHRLSDRQAQDQPDEGLLSFILPNSPNAAELVTRRSARQDQIREKKSGAKPKRLIPDPWEHMMRQPSRQCAMTRQLLPKTFLVGLAPVIVPGKKDHPSSLVVQPNLVLHSRFATRYKGQGIWMLCHKETVEAAVDASKRATPFVKALVASYGSQPMVQRPALLPVQIQHQLGLRLVQELEVLAQQLQTFMLKQTKQTDGAPPVLFGLTATETAGVLSKGEVDQNIIAVLFISGLDISASERDHPEAIDAKGPTSAAESDLRLLPLKDDDKRQIPLVVVRNIIPNELHQRCQDALQTVIDHERLIAGGRTTRKSTHLALRTWPGEAKGSWGVRVFEAIWRLRLWHGYGWDTEHIMGR